MPSSKRKSPLPVAKQQQLEQLPVLKKPLEQIGKQSKQLGVPGKYWEGRMTAAEKETIYLWLCAIREYSALHSFLDGTKGQGFQLQEMCKDCTGSHEHGNASGEIFWMNTRSRSYETFPDLKPSKEVVNMTRSPAMC